MAATPSLCRESACALLPRCDPQRTGAFLVLGPVGTRVTFLPPIPIGEPARPDAEEPARIAAAAAEAKLERVALVAAVRDDLADGGAAAIVATVRAIRSVLPSAPIELHVSDFGGSVRALRELLRCQPALFHHALVTAPRLFAKICPGGDYVRSLECLRLAREEFESVSLRSTVCLGLGETKDELVAALADLKSVRADEVLFVHADPSQAKHRPAPEMLEKVAAVAGRLRFPRFEILEAARSCAPPASPRRAKMRRPESA